jgi:hypothetical protein
MSLLTLDQQVEKLEQELCVRSNYNYFSDYKYGVDRYLQFVPVLAQSLAKLEDMVASNKQFIFGVTREGVKKYLDEYVSRVVLVTPMPIKPDKGLRTDIITLRRTLGEMAGITQEYQDWRLVMFFYHRKYGDHGYTDEYSMSEPLVLTSRSEAPISGITRKDDAKMIEEFALGMNQDEMLKRFPTAEEGQISFVTYKIEDGSKFGIFRPVEASEQESKGKVIWGPGYTRRDLSD